MVAGGQYRHLVAGIGREVYAAVVAGGREAEYFGICRRGFGLVAEIAAGVYLERVDKVPDTVVVAFESHFFGVAAFDFHFKAPAGGAGARCGAQGGAGYGAECFVFQCLFEIFCD